MQVIGAILLGLMLLLPLGGLALLYLVNWLIYPHKPSNKD